MACAASIPFKWEQLKGQEPEVGVLHAFRAARHVRAGAEFVFLTFITRGVAIRLQVLACL